MSRLSQELIVGSVTAPVTSRDVLGDRLVSKLSPVDDQLVSHRPRHITRGCECRGEETNVVRKLHYESRYHEARLALNGRCLSWYCTDQLVIW